MATRGRKKRKRKPGARTGVTVKPHTRTPRGPDKKGGKRKPKVIVDPYQRGKPKSSRKKSGGGGRKRRRRRRR